MKKTWLVIKLNKKSRLVSFLILFVGLLVLAKSFIPTFQTSNAPNNLYVHFIDADQGDAILIESDQHFMLIDAGEENKGSEVINYLIDQGVRDLDYVIGTHPHSDHIGGLDKVIEFFHVGKVILPNVTNNTIAFNDLLVAIADSNLKITKAVVGNQYSIGSASFTIVSPNGTDYEDLNNYSVGIKLVNGNNSFLLTGDAEELSEKEMIKAGIDLSADVLKLGHHGSFSSSSKRFLKAVNPAYAIISVGTDNQYNHPNKKVLQAMADRNITLYRTDKDGTVIFTSDGNNIKVHTNP